MANDFTQEQAARLEQERLRQQQTRDRIESMATNSIMAWLSRVLVPIVRKAVRGVIDFFWSFFTGR